MFLPPKSELAALRAAGDPLVTIESQTPVRDFDVFAFSVSFEWDYTNVLTMLRLAGVPARATDRTHHDPLVMIGGAVTFVNPEPLALFADVIAAGEGEALVPPLVDGVRRGQRSRRPAAAPGRANAATTCRRSTTSSIRTRARSRGSCRSPAPARPRVVKKAALKTTDGVDPPCTTIFTPDTEFGSRFLIEVVRGCANLCRFCWAGYNYLPVRAFPTERILELAAGRARALATARASCRSRSAITRTSRRS